jgi:hypothetical protein
MDPVSLILFTGLVIYMFSFLRRQFSTKMVSPQTAQKVKALIKDHPVFVASKVRFIRPFIEPVA